MILLHVLQFAGEDLTRKPYSYLIYVFFYMPWYFYKSGTFFRERGVKETLAKDFRKLILPLSSSRCSDSVSRRRSAWRRVSSRFAG